MKITKEELQKIIADKLSFSFQDKDGYTRSAVSPEALAKFLLEEILRNPFTIGNAAIKGYKVKNENTANNFMQVGDLHCFKCHKDYKDLNHAITCKERVERNRDCGAMSCAKLNGGECEFSANSNQNNSKLKAEPYTRSNALRDICSASVTAVSKSKVREILERLLVNYKRKSKKGVK